MCPVFLMCAFTLNRKSTYHGLNRVFDRARVVPKQEKSNLKVRFKNSKIDGL